MINRHLPSEPPPSQPVCPSCGGLLSYVPHLDAWECVNIDCPECGDAAYADNSWPFVNEINAAIEADPWLDYGLPDDSDYDDEDDE